MQLDMDDYVNIKLLLQFLLMNNKIQMIQASYDQFIL